MSQSNNHECENSLATNLSKASTPNLPSSKMLSAYKSSTKDLDLNNRINDLIHRNTALAQCQDFQIQENGLVLVEDEFQCDVIPTVDRIQRAVRNFLKANHVKENFWVAKKGHGTYSMEGRPAAALMLRELSNLSELVRGFPACHLHPCATLLLQCAQEAGPLPAQHKLLPESLAQKLCDQLNACMELVWARGQSNSFKAALQGPLRSARKNNLQLKRYVRALSERRGRLLICRMDIGFRKESVMRSKPLTEQVRSMQERRGALMHFIRKHYGDNLLGFAWKLEYGMRRGLHGHLMFIFDGRALRSDVTIVRHIGEHWHREIMRGEGTYYNCNAFKESYKSCGIGQYSKNVNPEMWKGIEKMCDYMTKSDVLMSLVTLEGVRTFGKGNMPKPKGAQMLQPCH